MVFIYTFAPPGGFLSIDVSGVFVDIRIPIW